MSMLCKRLRRLRRLRRLHHRPDLTVMVDWVLKKSTIYRRLRRLLLLLSPSSFTTPLGETSDSLVKKNVYAVHSALGIHPPSPSPPSPQAAEEFPPMAGGGWNRLRSSSLSTHNFFPIVFVTDIVFPSWTVSPLGNSDRFP